MSEEIKDKAGHSPVDLEVVNDADDNTFPEVAVLTVRDIDGRGAVHIKNASGATLPNTVWLAPGTIPLDIEIVADVDENLVPEIAALLWDPVGGQASVEVKNAAGPTLPNRVWYTAGYSPLFLVVMNDVDNDFVAELGVLMLRESDNRLVLQLRSAAGLPGSINIWFSP